MRWRFRSRLKSSKHLAAARIHNPGGRFLASCCIRAFGQKLPFNVPFGEDSFEAQSSHRKPLGNCRIGQLLISAR